MRAHWRQVRPILWEALANGAVEPNAALPALEGALPGGEALVAFTDHAEPSVRRAALSAALASNHPAVLSDLAELADDADEQVAAAAVATRERLRRDPTATRVRDCSAASASSAAGWEIADEAGSARSTLAWCACCWSMAGARCPRT